jgi:hypothetical protein
MLGGRKKLLIATVVWGDWHVGALTDFTLPSLLSPRNLPYLAERCDLECLIVTRPEDQARIEASKSVHMVRRFGPVNIAPFLPSMDSQINPFEFHHKIWEFASETAKRANAYVFNLPPDSVYADGAGAAWAGHIERERASIWWASPRSLDTIMPVLRDKHTMPDGALSISSRELVRLNLQHMHPLMKAFFADSDHFIEAHPEIVVWPVANEGLAVRAFVGEGRLFDPSRVQFTAQHVMTGNIAPNDHAFFDDSDDFCMVALAPAGHNEDFYRTTAKAEPVSAGRRWFNFDGASNDLVGCRKFRFHGGDVTEGLWRRVESRADLFMSRAAANRDFLRVAAYAEALGCSWTAALLARMAETTACLRAFPRPVRAFVFAPTDGVTKDLSIDDLLKPDASRRLMALLRSHVVLNERPELTLPQQITAAGGALRLRSLAGRDVIAAARPDGGLMVDRFKLGAHQLEMHSFTCIPLHGVLDPDADGRVRTAERLAAD